MYIPRQAKEEYEGKHIAETFKEILQTFRRMYE